MATAFPRFSSLDKAHFQDIRLEQRIAELCDDLEISRRSVEDYCLAAVVLITTVVFLMNRMIDSLWVLPFIVPTIAIGCASLQHSVTLYRHHARCHVMPSVCEAVGRLRHAVGDAPDLCLDRLVRAGALPIHRRHVIDDVFHGDYRGHRITLAKVDLWHGLGSVVDHEGGHVFQGIVVVIHWPAEPACLPADDLTRLVDGRELIRLIWAEGQLMLVIPCRSTPFVLAGPFEPLADLSRQLQKIATIARIPHRLIDHLHDMASDGPAVLAGAGHEGGDRQATVS